MIATHSLASNWAKRFHPVIFAESAGITLDPWQQDMVCSTHSRLLLNCSRQIGKSTTTAVLADYTALYEPNSLVLLTSPSERQSIELFRKCLEVYDATGRPIPSGTENSLVLELKNGSRICALPGSEKTIRGMSGARLLIIDESSRVDDALYKATRPMLAVSGGQLILLSSPFGARGFFWEAWKQRHKWHYFEIDATQCPRISQEFLDDERESVGDWWVEQEYFCKFHDPITSAFRSGDIERLIKPEVEQWALF